MGRRARRIGRWRLGRVLGVLVKAGFQIANPLPERGTLLLALGGNGAQGAQGVLYERGCSGPFVRRNTRWWQRRIIHRESMQPSSHPVNHPHIITKNIRAATCYGTMDESGRRGVPNNVQGW